MHSTIWPTAPGAIIGYRKKGSPIRLIAGGSGEGDGDGGEGQDGGTDSGATGSDGTGGGGGEAARGRRTRARSATVPAAGAVQAAATKPRRLSRPSAVTTRPSAPSASSSRRT